MLPFLKLKKEAGEDSGGSSSDDVIERDHDEGYDMLDAVAEDMLAALESKDKGMLKAALQSLVEHVQNNDEQQDQSLMEGQV